MENCLNKNELLLEIRAALKDEFVAQISIVGDLLLLHFLNGQKFKLELTEIE